MSEPNWNTNLWTDAQRKAMKERRLALIKEHYRKLKLRLHQEYCGGFTFPDEALPEKEPDDE